MDSCDHDPKPAALVLSEEPFGLDNGFGVTLNNLFAGWPDDKIYVFYTHRFKNYIPDAVRAIRQVHAPANAPHGRRYAIPMWIGLRPQWRNHYSRLWLFLSLRRFNPDILYILLHSESTLLFGEWIAKTLGIPYVVHVADDPSVHNRRTPQILRSARICYAISEPMAREYESRYNTSFKVLRNPASEDYYRDVSSLQPLPRTSDRRRIIRYLGRLHSWLHYESIRLLGQAVDQCEQENIFWNVELYGSADEAQLEGSGILNSHVVYRGPVSREKGVRLLHDADLLVLPLTYHPETITGYKFSFPTKLAEYLATGVPILILADAATASVAFCQENSVAHCITTPDIHQIKSFLASFWFAPLEFIEQAKRNPLVCKSNFSHQSTTLAFQRSLCSAAGSRTA